MENISKTILEKELKKQLKKKMMLEKTIKNLKEKENIIETHIKTISIGFKKNRIEYTNPRYVSKYTGRWSYIEDRFPFYILNNGIPVEQEKMIEGDVLYLDGYRIIRKFYKKNDETSTTYYTMSLYIVERRRIYHIEDTDGYVWKGGDVFELFRNDFRREIFPFRTIEDLFGLENLKTQSVLRSSL